MTVSSKKDDSAIRYEGGSEDVLVDYEQVVPDNKQYDFGTEEEEPIDEVHCVACKTNDRDKSENPDSVLCASCREQYIRYPVPRWIRIAMAAATVIVVFAMISTPVAIRDYRIYRQSAESYSNRDYNTAASGYLALTGSRSGSMKINERLFLCYAKAQRFYEAFTLLDEKMAGKDASDETYDEINAYIELIDSYYYTVEKMNAVIDEKGLQDDIPGSLKAMEALTDDEEINGAVLLFYQSQMNIYNGELDLSVAQLKEACLAEPRLTFFNAFLGNLQRRMGDYGQSEATYRAALAVNGDDETALVGLGVLELLEGNNKEALEFIKEAYDLNKNGDFVAGAYAIALHTSGKTGEAQIVYNEYKNSEFYTEDTTTADYLADKITLEDIYITKEG